MIEIKQRNTGVVLLVVGGANLRDADLRDAYLRNADLRDANLSGADLRGVNLSGADLRDANLRDANLRDANLRDANLRDANLRDANLRDANLRDANLNGADFIGANLRGVNLRNANLRSADLRGADLYGADLYGAKGIPALVAAQLLITPAGDLIGWKKLQDGTICKLLIPANAVRHNATGRKCRASYAIVLEGTGVSAHDRETQYAPGLTVRPDSFDPDRWNECAPGIHFFLTRREAEAY